MTDTLVIYYSYTGNSKKVANYVKEKLGADILELEPKIPFSDDYDAVVEEWQNNDIKRDVEIKDVTLKEYDLSSKDVIVASSNAGWLGHCFKDYESLLPNAHIKGELNLVFSADEDKRDQMVTSQSEVDAWIEKLNR